MDTPRHRWARSADRGRHGPRLVAAPAFTTRALAVVLVLVAYGFLGAVPHPPSIALGVAYGASALCLAVAAWRLWRRTFDFD